MATSVTLSLPDGLYERATRWATMAHQDVAGLLVEALSVALDPVHSVAAPERSAAALSDGEVLARGRSRMAPVQGRRLTALLRKQREGQLSPAEQSELLALMQVYDALWVSQSDALAEAVRRGLREPLAP